MPFLQRRIQNNVEYTFSHFFFSKVLQTALTIVFTIVLSIFEPEAPFAIMLYSFIAYMVFLNMMVIIVPVYYVCGKSCIHRFEWFNLVSSSAFLIILFAIIDHSKDKKSAKEKFYILIPCGIAIVCQVILASIKFNPVPPQSSKDPISNDPNVEGRSLALNVSAQRRSLSADHNLGLRGRSLSSNRSQSAEGRSLSDNRNRNIEETSFSTNFNSNLQRIIVLENSNVDVQSITLPANRTSNIHGTSFSGIQNVQSQSLPLSGRNPNIQGRPLSNRNPNIQERPLSNRNPNIQERPLSNRNPNIQGRPLSNRNPNIQERPVSNRNPNIQERSLSHRNLNIKEGSLSTRFSRSMQESHLSENRIGKTQERIISDNRVRNIQERPLPDPPVA